MASGSQGSSIPETTGGGGLGEAGGGGVGGAGGSEGGEGGSFMTVMVLMYATLVPVSSSLSTAPGLYELEYVLRQLSGCG